MTPDFALSFFQPLMSLAFLAGMAGMICLAVSRAKIKQEGKTTSNLNLSRWGAILLTTGMGSFVLCGISFAISGTLQEFVYPDSVVIPYVQLGVLILIPTGIFLLLYFKLDRETPDEVEKKVTAKTSTLAVDKTPCVRKGEYYDQDKMSFVLVGFISFFLLFAAVSNIKNFLTETGEGRPPVMFVIVPSLMLLFALAKLKETLKTWKKIKGFKFSTSVTDIVPNQSFKYTLSLPQNLAVPRAKFVFIVMEQSNKMKGQEDVRTEYQVDDWKVATQEITGEFTLPKEVRATYKTSVEERKAGFGVTVLEDGKDRYADFFPVDVKAEFEAVMEHPVSSDTVSNQGQVQLEEKLPSIAKSVESTDTDQDEEEDLRDLFGERAGTITLQHFVKMLIAGLVFSSLCTIMLAGFGAVFFKLTGGLGDASFLKSITSLSLIIGQMCFAPICSMIFSQMMKTTVIRHLIIGSIGGFIGSLSLVIILSGISLINEIDLGNILSPSILIIVTTVFAPFASMASLVNSKD